MKREGPLMPDHEGDAHLDRRLYKTNPNETEEPIVPGSPEWHAQIAKPLIEKNQKEKDRIKRLRFNERHKKKSA